MGGGASMPLFPLGRHGLALGGGWHPFLDGGMNSSVRGAMVVDIGL